MCRVYRQVSRGKKSKRWTSEFRDHKDHVRRIATHEDEDVAKDMAKKFSQLAGAVKVGSFWQHDPELVTFVNNLSPKHCQLLVQYGVLTEDDLRGRVDTTKSLTDLVAEHIEEFRTKPRRNGSLRTYATVQSRKHHLEKLTWTVKSIRSLTKECIEEFVATYRRHDKDQPSDATKNKILADVKAFCKWLRESRYMPRDWRPDEDVHGFTVTHEDSDRGGLTLDELDTLIQSVVGHGKTICGMSPMDRAVYYLLSVETCNRRGTMAKLTVGDFYLHGVTGPFVRVSKGVTKSARQTDKPLRQRTANKLIELWQDREPSQQAFATLPSGPQCAKMWKEDMSDAGIPIEGADGKRRPGVHALKHTGASMYVNDVTMPGGGHPRDIDVAHMTEHSLNERGQLNRYGGVRLTSVRQMVEAAPMITWPGDVEVDAGTDEVDDEAHNESLAA